MADDRVRSFESRRIEDTLESTNCFPDVSATTMSRSIATSSSSPSCISLAAPMNSFATEKLIETDKSDPMFESAALVTSSVDIPIRKPRSFGTFSHVDGCPTMFISQADITWSNECARRLFETSILCRQNETLLKCQLYYLQTEKKFHKTGVKRGYRSSPSATDTKIECSGASYGCSIGNILAFCGHENANMPSMLRCIKAALIPVSTAVMALGGLDANALTTGIASRRITRSQLLQISSSEAKGVHSRDGTASVVIGLAAAIFSVFSVLKSQATSSQEEDISWLTNKEILKQTLVVGQHILGTSIPQGNSAIPAFAKHAMAAEARALERAICSVDTAMRLSAQNDLATNQAFALQLSFFAKAVWPAGETVGENSHQELLQRLRTPLFYTSTTQCAFPGVAVGFVVPLSKLSQVECSRCGDSECSSRAGSSQKGSSVPSSSGRSANGDVDLDMDSIKM